MNTRATPLDPRTRCDKKAPPRNINIEIRMYHFIPNLTRRLRSVGCQGRHKQIMIVAAEILSLNGGVVLVAAPSAQVPPISMMHRWHRGRPQLHFNCDMELETKHPHFCHQEQEQEEEEETGE